MRRALVLLATLAVCLGSASGREAKRDPDSGVIRVLYIGAPFMPSPYQYFMVDPLLSPTPVQANQFGIPAGVIKKAMRLYLPRTKENLVSKYDVIGIDDATWGLFRSDTIQWMAQSIRENGLGMFMAGGYESFGGHVGFPSWGDTVLADVMPVECLRMYGQSGVNVVTNPEDEFMRSIPWEDYNQYSVFCGHNVLVSREEARQLSYIDCLGRRDPGWVWWDIGEGRFFASAAGFRGVSGWCQFFQWKHYPDFVCNLQYFLAGLTPPSDLALMYATRARFLDCNTEKQILTSTLDFIAKFNADTSKVDRKLQEALDILKESKRQYINLDLQKSKDLVDAAFDKFEEAYGLALEAKDAAIFWIFVTEWLVVSATSMVCAFALWTLMIRRRLYREVKLTRGGIRVA